MTRAGKSGESGKLLPGKFDHLEGNYDFSPKELHKTLWEICWKCKLLPGKFAFFPDLPTTCNQSLLLTKPRHHWYMAITYTEIKRPVYLTHEDLRWHTSINYSEYYTID